MASPTVLLVDDQKAFTDLFTTLLEDGLRLATVAFNDPKEALAALFPDRNSERPALQPTLIISDLLMPGMDGFAFLREVANRSPGIPSILVTGANPPKARVEASQPPNFLGVLNKPVSWRDLARMLCDQGMLGKN